MPEKQYVRSGGNRQRKISVHRLIVKPVCLHPSLATTKTLAKNHLREFAGCWHQAATYPIGSPIPSEKKTLAANTTTLSGSLSIKEISSSLAKLTSSAGWM